MHSQFGSDTRGKSTIGAGDDIFFADDIGVAHNALGY